MSSSERIQCGAGAHAVVGAAEVLERLRNIRMPRGTGGLGDEWFPATVQIQIQFPACAGEESHNSWNSSAV